METKQSSNGQSLRSFTQTGEQSEVQEELDSRYSLVKLSRKDIVSQWALIRQTILLSFPPGAVRNEQSVANIQTALLDGRAQAWMLTDLEGPLSIFTTVVNRDTISGTNSFFVYSMGSLREVPLEAWAIGFEKLREVCKRLGLTHVLSRTNNERLIGLLERFGVKTDVHMIELEV